MIDTDSEDSAWEDHIKSMRNIKQIKEIDYTKEDESE